MSKQAARILGGLALCLVLWQTPCMGADYKVGDIFENGENIGAERDFILLFDECAQRNDTYNKGEFEKTKDYEKRIAALPPFEPRLFQYKNLDARYNADKETLTLSGFSNGNQLATVTFQVKQAPAGKSGFDIRMGITTVIEYHGRLVCLNRDALKSISVKMTPATAEGTKGKTAIIAAFTPTPGKKEYSEDYVIAEQSGSVVSKPTAADRTARLLTTNLVYGKINTIYVVRTDTYEILHIKHYK